MYCRNCSFNIKDKDYCPSCGFGKNQGNTYCFFCGYKKPYADVVACPKCNTKFKEDKKFVMNYKPKYRLIAGFLQVFFGMFGLGRFYMHSYKIAILQCLVSFFTFGIGGIWGFIDGILILSCKINRDGLNNELLNY